MPGHQLQCGVVCNFFRTNRIEYQRLLIDPEKNKIRMGLGFAAFTAQHVGKTSLSAPDRRKKRSGREKMGQRNQAGPKNRDRDQNHQAMSAKPMHGGIISMTKPECRISKKLSRPNAEVIIASDCDLDHL